MNSSPISFLHIYLSILRFINLTPINRIIYSIQFHETITNDIDLISNIAQMNLQEKVSLLKIIKNHSINVHIGFSEHSLNQLLEHIKRYNPKIE